MSRTNISEFDNLEKYTDEKIWDDIMFMGIVGDIYLYKHCVTRRYMNIDNEGKFYKFTGNENIGNSGYVEITKEEAIKYLLE